jgi:senataxin
MSKGRLGFVGRALNHRSGSVDGLLVRVSQKLWTPFSALSELYVIKIGSNITAVREFNALMRVPKLPLKKYLLDAKIAANQEDRQQKGQVLDELPVAFQTFLTSKSNSSQLDAISAAAREYGNGGFTLIKGPPGEYTIYIHPRTVIRCLLHAHQLTTASNILLPQVLANQVRWSIL